MRQLPPAVELQHLDVPVKWLHDVLQLRVHLQHLRRSPLGPGQAWQQVVFGIVGAGIKHLAKIIDHGGAGFRAPVGHRAVLFQQHTQRAGVLALHLRLAHPGHLLKGGAGGLQVQREEIACQARCHVGPQGHGTVVRHITLHHQPRDGKGGQAHEPGRQGCQQQGGAAHEQGRGGPVHEAHIQRCGQGLVHA
jgi:hypothetical protein